MANPLTSTGQRAVSYNDWDDCCFVEKPKPLLPNTEGGDSLASNVTQRCMQNSVANVLSLQSYAPTPGPRRANSDYSPVRLNSEINDQLQAMPRLEIESSATFVTEAKTASQSLEIKKTNCCWNAFQNLLGILRRQHSPAISSLSGLKEIALPRSPLDSGIMAPHPTPVRSTESKFFSDNDRLVI